MLYEETVERGTLDLIKKLSADNNLQEFILVGGTALSLQTGHRKSIDIDLFNSKDFNAQAISDYMLKEYGFESRRVIKNGIFGFIQGVKVDILRHGYDPVLPPQNIESIRMASIEDIAAMKINSILNNGTRLKDFVDVYAILGHKTMEQMRRRPGPVGPGRGDGAGANRRG